MHAKPATTQHYGGHWPDPFALLAYLAGRTARVTSADPQEQMPPAKSKLGQLTPREIETLKRWITQGSEYEDHWAFIPLKPVEK